MITYLDMDGVACDFIKGACDLFSLPYNEILSSWPIGDYQVSSGFRMKDKYIWQCIAEAGATFWADLPVYPWTARLIKELMHYGPVIFLTSPGDMPLAAAGKMLWQKRNFPAVPVILCPTKLKHQLTRKDTILIDDDSDNILLWLNADGKGVLFPQPWNGMERYSDTWMLEMIKEVEEFKRGLK